MEISYNEKGTFKNSLSSSPYKRGNVNLSLYPHPTGTAVAQWLRCCATNWKVAGSIPDGVIGIFH